MEKAIVKFNNSNLAILCSYCHKILKTGAELTNDELFLVLSENEKDFIPAQYCETCKTKTMINETTPVDERDEAFQAFRRLIMEAPLDTEYKIKMLDALSDYLKLIF